MGNFLFFSAGIVQYFSDSNFAGKAIICVLILFSVGAWTIMIGKLLELLEIKKQNAVAEQKIAKAVDIEEFAEQNRGMKGSYAVLIKEAVSAMRNADVGAIDSKEMLSIKMGYVENAIARAVANQSQIYETKMVMLGSIISGAPFLGLLGTAWGVMDSFGAMGAEGASATLQSLAPGVSGALLTTIAGLVVAIPSVFGYNGLLSLSKGMVLTLENFASSLADKIELQERLKLSQKKMPASPARQDLQASDFKPRDLSAATPAQQPLRFDLDLGEGEDFEK
ncbi:MAG: MotA/TolQ/ExbB proton channel family protein [Opitutales bacterium]|nr:MotA/TolQ/ExbB proton channel family protein [Opitutales bacterium]